MPVRFGWNINFCNTICLYTCENANCLIVLSHIHLFNSLPKYEGLEVSVYEHMLVYLCLTSPKSCSLHHYVFFFCQYFIAHLTPFAHALKRISWKWYLEKLHLHPLTHLWVGCAQRLKKHAFGRSNMSCLHRSRLFSIHRITSWLHLLVTLITFTLHSHYRNTPGVSIHPPLVYSHMELSQQK